MVYTSDMFGVLGWLRHMNRANFMLVALFVAVMPWWRGSRDAAGLLIGFAFTGLGVFLLSRSSEVKPLGARGVALWGSSFVVWSLLSVIWSVNKFQTIRMAFGLLIAAALFCLSYNLQDRLKAWTAGYLIIAVTASLAGFAIYLTGSYERLTSVFYWANPFAAFLLPAVVLAFWAYASRQTEQELTANSSSVERLRRAGGRYFLLLQAAGIGAAFVLTDSRSAVLVLGLVIIPTLLLIRLKRRVWSQLGAAVLLTLALVVAINAVRRWDGGVGTVTPGARFSEAVRGESNSGQDRLYYLRSAVLIWRDHPIAGTGAGTYASSHPRYQLRTESASAHAHNYYAQTLSELGIVGLGLLLATVGMLIAGLVRRIKFDPGMLPWALAVVAALTHLGLDIDSQYPAIVWLTVILAGQVYQPSGQGNKASYQGITLAVFMLLALPVVSWYKSELSATKGAISQENGDYAAAAGWYNDAHSGVTYNPDYLTAEGINHFVQARGGIDSAVNLALALDKANQAAKIDPSDAQHSLLAARVLVEKRDYDGAVGYYRRAIEKDPYNEPDFYSELVGVELERGHLEPALEYADRGVGLYSDKVLSRRASDEDLPRRVARLLVARAAVKLRLGDGAGGRADATKALGLDPGNSVARQIIAQ